MPKFNSPKRRATRQRAGYTASGTKTGSEAKIATAVTYQISSQHLVLHLENAEKSLLPQFATGIGIAAIGGYIKCEVPTLLSYAFQAVAPGGEILGSLSGSVAISPGSWQRFGNCLSIDLLDRDQPVLLNGKIELLAQGKATLGVTSFWAVTIDVVTEYDTENVVENFGDNALENFEIKTALYFPEIFYWSEEAPFVTPPSKIEGTYKEVVGEQLVLKSCNRCTRFLPIDVENERNNLGYSNHCIKQAPCTHGSFSRFTIENWEQIEAVGPELLTHMEHEGNGYVITTKYGFQLECRPCKKFKVNAPLNPMRNTSQRREDSLRRRAFESLVRELTGADWIFYKFRRQQREEFDQHIWDKFGRRCFACNRPLKSMKEMDLDHTLPLVYLWPLDETATCLCQSCNSQKHDKFPYEFEPYQHPSRLSELTPGYDVDSATDPLLHQQPSKLSELSYLTGLDEKLLLVKNINPKALSALQSRVVWFFDEFLNTEDYQTVREGKRTADLIFAALQRVLNECNTGLNLIQEYRRLTGRSPHSISPAIIAINRA